MKRIFLVTGALFSLLSCKQIPAKDKISEAPVFTIEFNAFVPKELSANATPEQLASFAWSEFFSLNWRSSYSINGKRDYPDTTWGYSTDSGAFPDLAVWETYAHRTELRPYNDSMQPFDNPPHYSIGAVVHPSSDSASFGLFDNLDEANEIGSCNMYARVGQYQKRYRVLYQAKTNRDEYEYIYNNYPKKKLLTAATTNNRNNINKDSAYYPGAMNTCNCPPGILCLPCGGTPIPNSTNTYTGAIEVKTAWRQLTPADDKSKFFTRNVISYHKFGSHILYSKTEYALIAIHIIHKTQNYPSFVFATFEHVDVEENDMGFVELNALGNEIGGLHAHFPRLHPIPAVADASTQYAHKLLAEKNPKSIWKNYRLVGVQDTPTNDSTSFSFFLANYVVESDSTLANFHGSGFANPHNAGINTLYMGHGLSMGGCQGCHGVAQTTLGGDFSFLMDNIGKPVDTPDVVTSGSKLQKFLKAFKEIELSQQKK
jgi:hypothetical protein